MWRYLVGGIGALLLAGAAIFVVSGRGASPTPSLAAATGAGVAGIAQDAPGLAPPEASARTREEKRFGRYDKDRNGAITSAEYLASRHKAFARLDTNGDGALAFDEWAAKTITKFSGADANHDGAMTPAEFATTAPKRATRPKAKCLCPPPAADQPRDDEG